MSKLLTCFAIVFILFSCGRQKGQKFANDENTLVVSISRPNYDNLQSLDAAKYADSARLVKLETTRNNIISSINELFLTDDLIVVVDKKTASILFFDINGRYLHKIHKRGRGPGEYYALDCVMFDEKNDRILVYDANPRRLLFYDLKGNYISTIEEFCDGSLVRDMINLDNGGYLCYRQDRGGAEHSGLWEVNADGSYKNTLYTINDNYPTVFSTYTYNLCRLPNNQIGFVDQNLTDIFFVENDTVYKRVHFDLYGKTAIDFIDYERVEESYNSIFNSQEKGQFIFTEWADDQNHVFITVLNKKTGDLDVGVNLYPVFHEYFIPGNEFVRNNDPYIHSSSIQTVYLDQYLKTDMFPEAKKAIEDLFVDMSADQIMNSNPIIQLLYIKK